MNRKTAAAQCMYFNYFFFKVLRKDRISLRRTLNLETATHFSTTAVFKIGADCDFLNFLLKFHVN